MEMVILRGLPASGKSTYARGWVEKDRANRARVNRDHIRLMLDNGTFEKGVTESRVIVARDALISGFLASGISVIVDDTNLPAKTVKDLLKLAHRYDAEVKYIDLTFETLEDCLNRDSHRPINEQVGGAVIRDLHSRFVRGKGYPLAVPQIDVGELSAPEPYSPKPDTMEAVIVDLDGTMALIHDRDPYDSKSCGSDLPNQPIIDLVEVLAQSKYIVFVSGRDDGAKVQTLDWLRKYAPFMFHNIPGVTEDLFELHMRREGDFRADHIIKGEIFDEHIRDRFDIKYVLDDRDSVVAFWRSLGLTVLQVAEGNF